MVSARCTEGLVNNNPTMLVAIKRWQRLLWFSLVVWWLIGIVVLCVCQLPYQLPWFWGCLLGASQSIVVHWCGNSVQNQLQRNSTNVITLLFGIVLLSFVKMMLVAYFIVALSTGNTVNLGVEMLGFLGYNCCIVFVSAFCFRSVLTVDNGI